MSLPLDTSGLPPGVVKPPDEPGLERAKAPTSSIRSVTARMPASLTQDNGPGTMGVAALLAPRRAMNFHVAPQRPIPLSSEIFDKLRKRQCSVRKVMMKCHGVNDCCSVGSEVVIRYSGGLMHSSWSSGSPSLAESELRGGAKQGLTLVGEVRHQAVPRTRGRLANQETECDVCAPLLLPLLPLPSPIFLCSFALPAHHQSTASPTSAIWLQARWPPSTPYQRPRPSFSDLPSLFSVCYW